MPGVGGGGQQSTEMPSLTGQGAQAGPQTWVGRGGKETPLLPSGHGGNITEPPMPSEKQKQSRPPSLHFLRLSKGQKVPWPSGSESSITFA